MRFKHPAALALALLCHAAFATPQLIIVNASIFTADAARPHAEAVAIENGVFSAVGGNAGLIATIVQGFGKLGLTTDHAKKFVPVIMEFLRSRVGPDVVTKLENTLRA